MSPTAHAIRKPSYPEVPPGEDELPSNYYLFDPLTGLLEGYELDINTRAYQPMTTVPSGVRHGLYRNVEADWLRWLDASGRPLPSDEEEARTAEALVRAAERRAEDAESKLREALAEIEKLKAR